MEPFKTGVALSVFNNIWSSVTVMDMFIINGCLSLPMTPQEANEQTQEQNKL